MKATHEIGNYAIFALVLLFFDTHTNTQIVCTGSQLVLVSCVRASKLVLVYTSKNKLVYQFFGNWYWYTHANDTPIFLLLLLRPSLISLKISLHPF